MAQDFSVSSFLGGFKQGGALQSLFQASITAAPSGLNFPSETKFMIKTSSFPESTITANEIAYMGRTINIPGNRESQQWTTELYNDEDHKIRGQLLKWLDNINTHAENTRKAGWISLASYTGTLYVEQHTKEAKRPTNTAHFYNAWPSSVGEISLDWETNELQTYEVTWEFSYWTQTGTGGNVGSTGGGPAGGP